MDVFFMFLTMAFGLTAFGALIKPQVLVFWTHENARLKGFVVYAIPATLSLWAFTAFLPPPPLMTATSSVNVPKKKSVTVKKWISAAGNIWPGAMLYYGPKKMPVGTVTAMNDNYVSPTGKVFRAVKLRMKSGAEEWKDRDAIVTGAWYVRADDQALR